MGKLLDVFLILIFIMYVYRGYRKGFFLSFMNFFVYLFSALLSIFYRYEFSMYLKAKGVGDFLTDKFMTVFHLKEKFQNIDPSTIDPKLIKEMGKDSPIKDMSISQIQELMKSIPKEQLKNANAHIPKEVLDKLPKGLLEKVGIDSIDKLKNFNPIELISTSLLNVAAQAILFVCIYCVLRTIVYFIGKSVKSPIVGAINTFLGVAVGILTGMFWVLVLSSIGNYAAEFLPEFKKIFEDTIITKVVGRIFS